MDEETAKRVEKMKEYAAAGTPFYFEFPCAWSYGEEEVKRYRVIGKPRTDDDGNIVIPVEEV